MPADPRSLRTLPLFLLVLGSRAELSRLAFYMGAQDPHSDPWASSTLTISPALSSSRLISKATFPWGFPKSLQKGVQLLLSPLTLWGTLLCLLSWSPVCMWIHLKGLQLMISFSLSSLIHSKNIKQKLSELPKRMSSTFSFFIFWNEYAYVLL